MPAVISSSDAAIRLGVSLRTLARLKATGAIPYVAMSSKHHAFREEDILAFIAARVRNQ